MIPTDALTPVRWLICSEAVFHSVSDFWREEAGHDGLLAERLDRGLLEHVLPANVAARLATLAEEGTGRVVLVFDEVDGDAATLLDALPASSTDALELRVVDWRASPVDAVLAMNSPDFAAESGATATSPMTAEAANDTHWTTYRLGKLLGLGTIPAPDEPMRLSAPADSGERWTLSRSPVMGETAWMLIFRVDPGSIPRYRGRRVMVEVAEDTFDLGLVQDDGAAMTRVETAVDIAGAYVNLSDPVEET